MARDPRIEYAGAIYHVMNRGNHQGSIFEDDVDRGIFLRTLEESSLASGWVVTWVGRRVEEDSSLRRKWTLLISQNVA